MKVSELISKLQGLDQNAEVFGYCENEEGGGDLYQVATTTEFPYCKGDPPDTYDEEFVLLKF